MHKINEKDYLAKLVQDMKVKARDFDSYSDGHKYKTIIKKIQKGIDEETKKSQIF